MNENEKQRLMKLSITAVKVLLCVMMIFSAFIFVYYGIINRGDVIKKEEVRLIEGWDVTDAPGGEQTLRLKLPADIEDNEYLFFQTRRDVSVSIDGELRKDFVEKRDVNIPGGCFRRFYFAVPLKEEDCGKEMVIFRQFLDDYDRELPEFILGTKSGANGYLFGIIGMPFILSFIVLIFSLATFVVSIGLRLLYKQAIEMTYGALGILVISLWLITDSQLFPIVFGVNHVSGLLSYLLCLTMPLPLLAYMSEIQRGRHKKLTPVVALIAILNAVIFPLLHFTGIVPFDRMRTLANFVLVVLAVSGIAVLVIDAVKGNTEEYHYTFIGFLGFLVGCLLELTFVMLDITIIRESTFMVTGLGFLLTFIVIQQVHDLRMMNLEKQHAIDISEAKTRFLASMSHEIRTPINAILGMNEMILRENSDRTVDEYANSIKTSGKMLLMLVNDVLDFTKIESGKLEINESAFLASEMLYDVISLIRERAEEKALALKTEITDEVPDELISDEFRIRQILVNLLNNAVKYTETGTVTLAIGGSYSENGYMLSLSVKDTGKGIKKEDQEHLFEAFSRADLESNVHIEGTGLGLAIVKSIVESMDGELGVESEYGKGSVFWVKLPVGYGDKQPLAEGFMQRRKEQTPVTSQGTFKAPDAKILAVDDNRSNLTIVKLFLKQNDIVPDLCTGGMRAIELCKEKRYDLILLDHMMPDPDGIKTLHSIRSDAESLNKDTKAVVLTANAVAGSRRMYIDEGFEDYLTKPLDSRILEETVKRMLPKDKVHEVADRDPDTERAITEEKTQIEGFDYEAALRHCGGSKELLAEITGDIAKEGIQRIGRMKRYLQDEDIAAYRIDAHAAKSSMATIGLKAFSERAKKHEFAARDGDVAFIREDAGAFLEEYAALCEELERLQKQL